MEQPWQPTEIRLVPSVPLPARLYVCLARIKPRAAGFLKASYQESKPLPKNLASLHREHLVHEYNFGEKGSCWEGGPSPDFKDILYVFSTNSLDEARGLVHTDPFYQEGIIFQDTWFGWSVHVPPWKLAMPERGVMEDLMRDVGILPTYPPEITPRIIEKKVDVVTPPKLVVCFSRADTARIKQLEVDDRSGKNMPAYLIEHIFNRLGPGGTSQMGYDWEAGPSDDQAYDLSIFSVDSVETARRLRESDRFSRYGLFYEHRLFEWCIFTPFSRASPEYKGKLRRFLGAAGVKRED